MAAGVIREVNLTRLRCAAYSSSYSLAPVRPRGAGDWSYGIRVAYSVPGDDEASCRTCQVSGGSCGYDDTMVREEEEEDYAGVMPRVCICGGGFDDAWNSTSTCDSTGRAVDTNAVKFSLEAKCRFTYMPYEFYICIYILPKYYIYIFSVFVT